MCVMLMTIIEKKVVKICV